MNRFKTSKFRNTTPKIAKKDGNRLAASASLVAFCSEQAACTLLGCCRWDVMAGDEREQRRQEHGKSTKGLQSNKDSRILWVKDDFLVTTGFDMVRKTRQHL
ncbi:unnamed protein product [Tetraodon nigroviridis]|uniref:(spotted green pufferfish) hypothetical protein n=1 Tax=Tetraodon nigroviridis TaxID=99883 RepID=Q4SGR2_TETNG|nr:unnamed protein product [Tetraodon nigroviridis]